MRKFSQAIPALHEAEGAVKSELQKSYAEYFSAKLTKFGVKSPAELAPDKKSEFFNEITKDWTRGEGATKAGQADVDEHGVKESEEVNEGHFKEGDKVSILSKSDKKKIDSGTVSKIQKDGNVVVNGTKSFNGEVVMDPALLVKESLGLNESAMGDVHIMAQDAKDFAAFKKEFVKEFKVEGKDNNKDLDAWLKQVYDSAANESEVNEGKEIKSDSEFKEYAMSLLKKAHPDDFDEEKANATVEGILKKCDGDFGAAVGMITSSLGESATNEKKDGITPEEMARIQQLKKLKDLKANEEEECPMCKCKPCECYTNEGNAFGDAVKKAKDAGEKEFEFQGKTYKVEESEAPVVNDLNESDTFIKDLSKFANQAALIADISKNAGPALEKFLKASGINWPGKMEITVDSRSNRLKLETKPVTGKDLGILQYGFKEVYLTFFNGGNITLRSVVNPDTMKGELEFKPSIWTNLNYNYNHGSADTNSQGSNGCTFYIPGNQSGDIWYDIVNGVWLDRKGAQKAGF